MASAYDVSKGTAGAGYPASAMPKMFMIENIIDFASVDDGNGPGAADTLQALKVSAFTFTLLAGFQIITPGGATLTLDMGDGDDTDAYLDGVDANAAADTMYVSKNVWAAGTGDVDTTSPTTQLYGLYGGKLYSVDDTIDFIVNNANAVAKLRAFAIVFDLASR